jgi:hypothetical protein
MNVTRGSQKDHELKHRYYWIYCMPGAKNRDRILGTNFVKGALSGHG